MAEFLVRIDIDLPATTPAPERERLLEAEAARGRELLTSGHLAGIWRVPGRFANISLYRAGDATELHHLLTSLPLFPWMSIGIEPLADHPLTVQP
jgi:muconolactone D-isomerase